MDDYNRGGHSKYSMKMHIIYLSNIGNVKYYGQMDVLHVALDKSHKRLSKDIFKTKDSGNRRCVSTHLKVCGFATDNFIKVAKSYSLSNCREY